MAIPGESLLGLRRSFAGKWLRSKRLTATKSINLQSTIVNSQ